MTDEHGEKEVDVSGGPAAADTVDVDVDDVEYSIAVQVRGAKEPRGGSRNIIVADGGESTPAEAEHDADAMAGEGGRLFHRYVHPAVAVEVLHQKILFSHRPASHRESAVHRLLERAVASIVQNLHRAAQQHEIGTSVSVPIIDEGMGGPREEGLRQVERARALGQIHVDFGRSFRVGGGSLCDQIRPAVTRKVPNRGFRAEE